MSDTSRLAYESILPRLTELQAIVMAAMQTAPDGMTDHELEAFCGSHGSTYRTRRAELTEKGLVEFTGEKRLVGGTWRKVWKLKDMSGEAAA